MSKSIVGSSFINRQQPVKNGPTRAFQAPGVPQWLRKAITERPDAGAGAKAPDPCVTWEPEKMSGSDRPFGAPRAAHAAADR
ncbi:hypothetical protein [Meridianimarinicoccus aquatilis]|uniref:Uncharacterized protein n=1 Tax=Meridianimarinicoccus aquatilis TaxID=2552766 RepID=A0A4R6AVJ7_9RHOB|nr:hypothetical protein [Fluviibacterium aquatile]TDL86276.1 hypothetical protein E2L05_13795 [Fluviibacterium aquatile]